MQASRMTPVLELPVQRPSAGPTTPPPTARARKNSTAGRHSGGLRRRRPCAHRTRRTRYELTGRARERDARCLDGAWTPEPLGRTSNGKKIAENGRSDVHRCAPAARTSESSPLARRTSPARAGGDRTVSFIGQRRRTSPRSSPGDHVRAHAPARRERLSQHAPRGWRSAGEPISKMLG